MRLADFDPALVEALCFYEGFRHLGFTPDELFLAVSPDPTKWRANTKTTVMMVISRGGEQYDAPAGESDASPLHLMREWQRLAELWNSGQISREEFGPYWANSKLRQNGVLYISQMVVKHGFDFSHQQSALTH